MAVGGSALRNAAENLLLRAVRFADGRFECPHDGQGIDWAGLFAAQSAAGAAFPLKGTGRFEAERPNYPNGCQVSEVEIDTDTGAVRLVRCTAVDDVGRVLNPLLYAGQIQGGIVQGAGQALYEQVRFDSEGQLRTNAFVDYAMPRAADFPRFELGTRNVPTTSNPLGVKGAGESGTIGAAPAIVNAIVDALAPLGVSDLAMPANPQTVWRAIRLAAGTERGPEPC